MEEESISDANNVTVDTFMHTSNTHRENSNAIFTTENIDKLDKLEDSLEDLTINDAKYYESNTAIKIDSQGDLTRNPDTVIHTSNGNETVTHIRNRGFEQKILSNRTIPGAVLKINPIIGQRLAPIVVVPQTLLTSATKEFVADAGSSGGRPLAKSNGGESGCRSPRNELTPMLGGRQSGGRSDT